MLTFLLRLADTHNPPMLVWALFILCVLLVIGHCESDSVRLLAVVISAPKMQARPVINICCGTDTVL